jgi:hypothetical protein
MWGAPMEALEDSNAPAVDMDEAHTFLARLGSVCTFQTFDESSAKRKGLIRVLHGTLGEHASTLATLNQQGAGVFVMVNAGDGKGRESRNVQSIRAVFVDLDGAPLAPIQAAELAPHIIVESSPGRWHAYWLADGVPLEQFKPMQQAIAALFAGDRSVCDLPRVMRLPGFLHNKRKPFLSHIIEQQNKPPYSYADIVEWLGFGDASNEASASARIAASGKRHGTIPEGERNSTLFARASGLAKRGIRRAGVNVRLQRMNAELCKPPLCASEVDTIAMRASDYGSQGFAKLSHALLDSSEWLALPAASCAIVLAFYRRFDGSNNGRLCIPWSDFQGQHGIDTSRRFYSYLRRAVSANLLIQTAGPRNSQSGRTPAMYAIPDQYLAQVSKQHMGPSLKTAHLNR